MSSSPRVPQRNDPLLSLAEDIKNLVIKKLPNGSDNKPGLFEVDNPAHAGEFVRRVRAQTKPTITCLADVLCRAKVAKAGKTGNCGEMGALAFAELFKLGIHPLFLVAWPWDKGDHCFVIFGTHPHQYVCDPWAGRAYRFASIGAEMAALYQGRPPSFRDLETIFTCLQAGSKESYKQLTASQSADDLMDLSKDNKSPSRDGEVEPMDISY